MTHSKIFRRSARAYGLVVHDQGLEGGGQVDFAGPGFDELVEGRLGQGAGAVLDGSAHAVFLAGLSLRGPQGLEIDGHLGQGAVGQDDAAVAGAGLDADLADALVGSAGLS